MYILLLLVVGVALAFFLSQWLALSLPSWWSALDRKPFNCQPCLSFHIMVLWVSFWSVLLINFLLWLLGMAVALFLFASVSYLDQKKIIK